MKKIITYIKDHKLIVIILMIAVIGGGYYWYQRTKSNTSVTRYVLGTAAKGSIIVAVSGSGQVSAINQVDIKPEASGKLVTLKVKDGQTIKTGDIIGTIDAKSSLLSLQQANLSYESAQANYKEVMAGITADDKKLAQITVDQAQSSYEAAVRDLENTKRSTSEEVAQAEKDLNDLLDLSNTSANNQRDQVIIDVENKIYTAKNSLNTINSILTNDDAENNLSALNLTYLPLAQGYYNQALPLVDIANSSLNTAKSNKNEANIGQMVNDTLNLLEKVDLALDNTYLVLENTVTSAAYGQNSLDGDKASVNSGISSISTAITTIKTSWQNLKDAITTAQNDLTNAKLSTETSLTTAQAKVESTAKSLENAKINYDKTVGPATEDEIRTAKAQITSAQISLNTAQLNYRKNIITTPIDGVITGLEVSVGDEVAASAVIATVVTPNKMAEVTLNEVDAAKVKIGQKATLTFNAVDDLSITGTVSNIDMIGTVAQGVVSYSVQIVFDVQDDRIKPSMSVSADIITDQRINVITVPNAAVKTDNSGNNYIQELNNLSEAQASSNQPLTSVSAPINVTVTIGLADDTNTEIVSGLDEGDKVITSTITGNSSGTTSQTGQTSTNRNSGLGGATGGGAVFRAIRD